MHPHPGHEGTPYWVERGGPTSQVDRPTGSRNTKSPHRAVHATARQVRCTRAEFSETGAERQSAGHAVPHDRRQSAALRIRRSVPSNRARPSPSDARVGPEERRRHVVLRVRRAAPKMRRWARHLPRSAADVPVHRE
uniref:Uncharacterized protein n=1 Tax=Corethron hystrix TaxID=216773 RepID=A0A7S1BKN5_9STRA